MVFAPASAGAELSCSLNMVVLEKELGSCNHGTSRTETRSGVTATARAML